MARRDRRQTTQEQTKPPAPIRSAQHSNKAVRRKARLMRRREAKFAKHKVEIVERVEEVEFPNPGGGVYLVRFTHMILAGRAPVGQATSYRHALKRAHQHCRNMGH